MAKVLVSEENLTNIANSIRAKNGTTDKYKPSEMSEAIDNITTSVGGKFVAPSRINFSGSINSSIDLTNLDTSNVTNMSFMFSGCSSLTTLDLTPLDTSNVTDMISMFNGCPRLDEDSLHSIVKMLLTAISMKIIKTLKYIGLNETQATTCTTFDEWQELVAKGWTTGY